MKIENAAELQEFLMRCLIKGPDIRLPYAVYVSTKVRNEWVLNHMSFVLNGLVHYINFENSGGGVWAVKPYKSKTCN